jgi:hypothetical protein
MRAWPDETASFPTTQTASATRAAGSFAMSKINEPTHESVNKPAPVAPVAPVAQPAKKSKKQSQPLPPLPFEERLARGCFDLKEVAQRCSCSKSAIDKDAREGRLAVVKMGGRTRVLGPELARFMNTKRGE